MNNSFQENKRLVALLNWRFHNKKVNFDKEQTISIAIYLVMTTDLVHLVVKDNHILDFQVEL